MTPIREALLALACWFGSFAGLVVLFSALFWRL